MAVVLGAIAAWPALPCDTDWVRASKRGCLWCGRVCVRGCRGAGERAGGWVGERIVIAVVCLWRRGHLP